MAAALLALAGMCLFAVASFAVPKAQGSKVADSSTLGLGDERSSAEDGATFDATEKISSADEGEDAAVVDDVSAQDLPASAQSSLKNAPTRAITVEDPDPVVVLAAVDEEDPNTVAAAAKVGTTDPYPTAERLQPDTSEEGWMIGQASVYDVASSSTRTYSGRAFSDYCITVAVPQGQEYLIGRAVEITDGETTVVATVTDTGGFAKYGRVLDLGMGVARAFGCSTASDWGVRTVYYRFL